MTDNPRLIAGTPAAPGVARRHVGELLADVPGDVVEAVALMVSELATNCVVHGRSDFTVSVERRDGEVRVDVADDGGGAVARREPSRSEPGGHGLRIVEQLSDEWGVLERFDSEGKTVWFSVRLGQSEVVIILDCLESGR